MVTRRHRRGTRLFWRVPTTARALRAAVTSPRDNRRIALTLPGRPRLRCPIHPRDNRRDGAVSMDREDRWRCRATQTYRDNRAVFKERVDGRTSLRVRRRERAMEG